MYRLLYYPNFEIQNRDFLKFALLYIDEIRPIIPGRASDSLGKSMREILQNTQLINPYSPSYENGFLASAAAIKYFENKEILGRYEDKGFQKPVHNPRNDSISKLKKFNFTLYQDKYTDQFENYCLENGLGVRCDEGIRLNIDTAFTYMSLLAEIISKETELEMITDDLTYSDPVLRNGRGTMGRLNFIKKEIQFYVPVDLYRIPLERFIELRSNHKFERVRRNFVNELNIVLDSYDRSEAEVDLYNLMDCKKEIYGLLKEIFVSCAALAVGVHSFGNMYSADKDSLVFWGNAGNIGISLDTLQQHCFEAREYIERIKNRKQARKYLANLKRLYTGIL